MRTVISLLLWIGFLAATTASAQKPSATNQIQPGTRNVVFVCEHGAALSIIAAAYFNQLARKQHENWHAIARGVTPQENISVAAAAGLKKDGVATEVIKPEALTQDDLDRAEYVVTFLPLPKKLVVKTPLEKWDEVRWDAKAYDNVRDAILKHLQQLLPALPAKKR